MKYTEGISIICCCFNSSSRLSATLGALARLKLPTQFVELLLVDNNSTDNTAMLAVNEWQKFDSDIQLVLLREERPGLSYARRKGLINASYSYVLFCDDDNWLAEDYLLVGFKYMRKNSLVGACFGSVFPAYEKSPPYWISECLKYYAVGSISNRSCLVNPPIVPWGAGLWIRLESLLPDIEAGRESQLSDRRGNELSSGGDTEFCYWIRERGYEWHFEPQLVMKHFLPHSRMTKTYVRELVSKIGESQAIVKFYYGKNYDKSNYANISIIVDKLVSKLCSFSNYHRMFIEELKRQERIAFRRKWNELN